MSARQSLLATAPAPAGLRLACAALAVLGALMAAAFLWVAGVAPGVERDGALVVASVSLAALALAWGRSAPATLAVGILAGASLLIASPLLGGAPEDAAVRAPFAALCALAATAVGLLLTGARVAHRAAAVLAGLATAVICARSASALSGDPGPAELWPLPQLFIAPLAMVPLLVYPRWRDVRAAGGDRMAAAAHLLLDATIGAALLALLGHAMGSDLLVRGVGANPLPPQKALATLAAALLLAAVIDQRRSRYAWAAALGTFAMIGLASVAFPALGDSLRGEFLPPEGVQPGRSLIGSTYHLLLVGGGLAAGAARASTWGLRFAQFAGLVVAVGAAVALSGMVSEVLYGINPILGADRMSFLGLFGLLCAGTALFLAAARRVTPRRVRVEAWPAAVAALALAITLSLWGGASRQSLDAIAATSDVALDALTRTLEGELESRDRDIGRLAARVGATPPAQQAQALALSTEGLSVRYRTLARVTWVPAEGGSVSVQTPRAALFDLREVGMAADLTGLERRLLRTARRGAAGAFGAAPAVDGGLPRLVVLAQRGEGPTDAADGVLLALFVVDDPMLPVLIGKPVAGFGASVALDGVAFGVLGASATPMPGSLSAQFLRDEAGPMFGMPVRIAVWPLPATVDRLRSRLPQAILGAGLLISTLLGLVAGLGGAARDRARRAVAAQLAAESSRREIMDLLEGLPDPFFAYDRQWRFTHFNRAAESLVERQREALLGTSLWDSTPRAREYFAPHFERAMHARTVERFEFFYEEFQVWLAVQVFPLPDGIGAVAHDVSRQREVLQTLRRSEADLAQALEIAELARLEMDPGGRVTWSGAAARVLGCAAEDLPPDRAAVRRLWHPDDAPALEPLVEEGIRSGRGYHVEHRIVRPDGSVRWVHTVARVLDEGAGAVRVVATVQDITERKLQARAVLERDRFFDGSRDLFCIVSRDGRFLQVNPALCRAFGVPRDGLIGRLVFDFTVDEEREASRARFTDALFGVPGPASVFRIRTADGSIRSVHWTSSRSPDGDLYVVGHDVTDRMAAEAERERTLAELRARNEELQQFAYIASHDLQEPLRKIRAFCDRLATRFGALLGDDGRDYLARMDNAAQRMSSLIADLLDYSRVSTRGEPFVAVPLADALADALGDLEEAIQVAGARVEHGPLPIVEGDRRQLAQVFQNLVGNAVKYRHPARVPQVSIAGERFEEPLAGTVGAVAPWVRVRVVDNGIGFDMAHRERIFAPFQRLHGRSEYAGTGIGLAIVRKIVERHGGRVRAEARPGEGATFVVELPLRQARGVDAA